MKRTGSESLHASSRHTLITPPRASLPAPLCVHLTHRFKVHCLSRDIGRELKQKQSSWDLSCCLDTGCKQWFNMQHQLLITRILSSRCDPVTSRDSVTPILAFSRRASLIVPALTHQSYSYPCLGDSLAATTSGAPISLETQDLSLL